MRNQVKELESSDDSELLAAVRAGNDAAFGELYRRHVGAARAAARALTRSSADADDAVAEAFARVLAVMRRGGGPEIALRPYLMTVVRNVCFDRGAARDRESLPGETDLMAAVDDLPSSYENAELDHFTEANLVSRAFASLSPRWKQVLWQTDIEGRTPRELAEELQLAPTAVAALAFRAREGLADAYLAAHVQHRPTAQCDREPSELARYVRNRMRTKEEVTFQAHLDQCHRCTEAIEELRVVSRPLRGLAWPALIGAPVLTYGGKILGIIRRVVTAQFVTTASAAAVTVATVGVATNQVPWEPFDALRPMAFVEAPAPDAPVAAGAPIVVATEGVTTTLGSTLAPADDAALATAAADAVGSEPSATPGATTTVAPAPAGATPTTGPAAPTTTAPGGEPSTSPVTTGPAATPTTTVPAPDTPVGDVPVPEVPTGTDDGGTPPAPTTTTPAPPTTVAPGDMVGVPIGGSGTLGDGDESAPTTTVPPTTTTAPPATTTPDTTVPAEEPPAGG